MAPQYFALPCLECPFMGKKALFGEKFEDFLWEKATHAQKNQGFSEEKSLARQIFFWPPQSQNPTSLPAP